MFNKSTNNYLLLLFILAGIVIGGLVSELLEKTPYLSALSYGEVFGLTEPITLDLGVISLTFGFTINLTIASIIFIFLAFVLYKKVK